MGFPTSVADEVLVRCGRHCCLCGKFAGQKMELHHIIQVSEGGDNSVDNCIPLCFDCHADVKSYNERHPKGRKYTEKELKGHRDNCYQKHEIVSNFQKKSMDANEIGKVIFNSNKSDAAVMWGYSGQDSICPLFPDALVLISGYAGSKKSTYVQHIVNWNIKRGQKVAYCCLNSHPMQIAYDIIAEAAHINAYDVKFLNMTEEDCRCVEEGLKGTRSENLALLPYDKVSKADDIISLVETSGADIVVIDDLNGVALGAYNSNEEFLYELKSVAGQNGTTIFCIYHLNMPKQRSDMRPMLCDFPSDSYYRLFDVVQMLFKPEMHYGVGFDEKDILEVINLKGARKNPVIFRMVSPENITGIFEMSK